MHLNSRVLASLLPGLRQLRAPLAAGFVWLTVVWLGIAPIVPRPENAPPGAFRDFYDLASVAGQSGVSVAAGFVAYLLGILSVQLTTTLRSMPARIRSVRKRESYARQELPHPSTSGRRALTETVVGELVDRASTDQDLRALLDETRTLCGERLAVEDRDVAGRLLAVRLDVESYVDDVVADLQLMPLRLIDDDKKKDLYAEFDRRRAESEFRAALVLPLAALAVLLAVRVSPWFALALLLAVVLVVQSYASAVSAADVLAESIRAQGPALSSPVLAETRAGDLRKRKGWLQVAAKKDYPLAAMHVAVEVERHQEVQAAALPEAERQQKIQAAAQEWYEIAAKAGDPTAKMWLANRLYTRNGPENPEAEELYVAAAKAGNPDAQVVVAWTDPSGREAIRGAYAGDPAAMTETADALMLAGREAEAEGWYIRADAAGHAPATQQLLAWYRRTGNHRAAHALENKDRTPVPDVGTAARASA